MAVTNDDIQRRNKEIQDRLATAKTQRAQIISTRDANQPTWSTPYPEGSRPRAFGSGADRGLVGNQPFATGAQRVAYDQSTRALAENNAVMGSITNDANALTADAKAFTAAQTERNDQAGAAKLLKGSGVQYQAPTPAPAPVATPMAASATSPSAGARPALNMQLPGVAAPKPVTIPYPVGGAPGDTSAAAATPVAAPRKAIVFNPGVSQEFGGTGQVVKDSLASSIDKNGVPTFDNASIQRMLERDGQAAVSGTSTPAAVAAPAVASGGQIPTYNSQAQGAVIGDPNNNPRKRLLSDLDTAIFRASANPNSRSKRSQLSELVAAKTGMLNQDAALENASALAASQQQNETQRAMISQAGEDRRSTNQINAQMQMEGMRQAGDNARYARAYRQPLTIGDKIGLIGDDGVFKALKGEDGKDLTAPKKAESGVDAGDRLKSIDSERKSLMDSLATAADADKPAIAQRLQLLQEQGDQLRGTAQPAAKAPDVGTITNGYRFKGGDPANKDSWEKVN